MESWKPSPPKDSVVFAEDFLATAKGELIALIDVVVHGDQGGIAQKQDKPIGVAAIAKVEFLYFFPDSLPQPGKPGFGALEGVAIAIKLICTEGLVADTQENCRLAESRGEAAARKNAAVFRYFAVRSKPCGEGLARAVSLFTESTLVETMRPGSGNSLRSFPPGSRGALRSLWVQRG